LFVCFGGMGFELKHSTTWDLSQLFQIGSGAFAGWGLASDCNPPICASCVAGITDVHCHT
jgi:hypothetical protein